MDEKEHIYKKVRSVIRRKGRSSYIGEDDFVSLVKGGITINFHIKNPSYDIENVFRTVRRAQKIIKDRFGHDLEKIDMSIYDSKEELREEGGRSHSVYASWIAGIFDGKIRIIAEEDDEEPESLYIILTHEVVHLAIYEMGKGNCPYWLDEGLAVHLSQELPGEYLAALDSSVRADRTFPLELLENALPAQTDEGLRKLIYAQTSSITEYLVESHGWDTIRSMPAQCRTRQASAILADMGLNYYLLEQGWKRWFREKEL